VFLRLTCDRPFQTNRSSPLDGTLPGDGSSRGPEGRVPVKRHHWFRAAVGLLALCATTACAPAQKTISHAPSLAPVDTTRPMVRYKPIQGAACGEGSALAAIWDMKKLVGVDGYVEVTIETTGDCTTATSFPFTYGTEPRNIRLRKSRQQAVIPAPSPPSRAPALAPPRPAPEPPVMTAAPRPAPEPEPEPDTRRTRPAASTGRCAADCGSFSQLAGSSDLIRNLVRKECIDRCIRGDATYQSCVRNSYRSKDVGRCNDLPER